MSEADSLCLYDEERARKVAYIIGPQSATARALAELERRRKAGEDVCLYRVGCTLIVGPPVRSEDVG